MRRSQQVRGLIFLLAILVPGLRAESELERLSDAFDVKLLELAEPLQKLEKQYLEHLKRQKETQKGEGNLKALLAVEEELKTPGEAAAIAAFPGLKRAQDVFLQTRGTLEKQELEKRVLLYQQYKKSLTTNQVELTKAGKIAEAKLVLAEVERIDKLIAEMAPAAAPAEVASGPDSPENALTKPGDDGKIDLNSATLEELKTLDGIGDVMGQRIIDGRPYRKIEDLLEVDGVGPGTLEKIQDKISVK